MIPDLLQRIKASDDTGPAFASVQKRMTSLEQKFAAAGAQMSNLGTVTRQGFNTIALGATGAVAGFLTLGAVVGGTRAALERFGAIADKSAAAGIDPEFFQGIAQQAGLAGVGIDTVAGALTTFSKNVGLAAEGRGKMFTTLSAINPELLKMLQLASSQEDRVLMVADALARARDTTEQAAIATAVWGDAGSQLVPVFNQGADAISLQITKARELGLIVDRGLIAQADELGDKWDVASQVLDLKVKGALVSLAPLMTDLVTAAADFATYMGQAWEASKGVDERSRAALESQFSSLQAIKDKAEGGGFFSELQWTNGGASERYASVLAELRSRAFDDLRTGLAKLPGASGSGVGGGGTGGTTGGGAGDPLSGVPKITSALGQISDAGRAATDSLAELGTTTEDSIFTMMGNLQLGADQFASFASEASGLLGQIFEDNKAAAIASAVLDASAGIAKTLAAYPYPWNIGMAGLHAAAAAVQVQKIASTSQSSTSVDTSVAGGSSTASNASGTGGVTQGVTIQLTGNSFSAQGVMGLLNELQSALGMQGKQITISHVNGA